METAVLEPKQVTTALQKFNVTKDEIVTLKTNYEALTIKGIDDRAGYKAVDEARKEVKKKRVEIDKTRKSLNEDAQNYIKQNNADAKEYIDILEAVETICEGKLQAIDTEKARIEKEKEIAEQKRVADRVKLLLDNGCSFDSVNYAIGQNLSISHPTLTACSDEIFNGFLDKVQAEHAIELAAKAEQEQKEKEAAEKIEAERLAEIERQKVIAEQNRIESERLEKLRKEQEEKAAEIERKEMEIKEREAAEQQKIFSNRANALKGMGMTKYQNHFGKYDVEISFNDIYYSTDEKWLLILDSAGKKINEAQEKEAIEAKRIADEKEAQRLKEIEDAKAQAIKDEQERQRLAEIERIEAVKKQTEEDDRQAALMPDKSKLIALSDALGALSMPVLESDASKAILVNVKDLITKTQLYISKQIKSL